MPRFYLFVPRWVGRAMTPRRRAVPDTPEYLFNKIAKIYTAS